MLPMRWSQPPWRNIEVSGANQSCLSSITQAMVSLIGTEYPSGSRPRNSPGISPNSQTDLDR